MQTQLALPVRVHEEEIARKRTLGDAIELCAELAGYTRDKETSTDVGVDKAQLSRWKSGGEGIMWPKFERLMDACGNDAPLLWMLYKRGYDIHALRKRETETERKLREALEERDAERAQRLAVEESMRRIITGVSS